MSTCSALESDRRWYSFRRRYRIHHPGRVSTPGLEPAFAPEVPFETGRSEQMGLRAAEI
jgi:hypothetical protein